MVHCVNSKINLDECSDIHAAHILGVHFKDELNNELINNLIKKTNPLPACYNNGPDKCFDKFFHDMILSKTKEDLEKLKNKFIKNIESKNYPKEIKEFFISSIKKLESQNGKIVFNE